MNLVVAKSAGFCFGVKRAVNMVYDEIGKSDVPVYTYGPIIHNEEVVRDLEEKGIRVIRSLDELEQLPHGKIIVRSHGISKAEHEKILTAGFELLDATCPFVSKIHGIAAEERRAGRRFVIIGDPGHPEVQAIMDNIVANLAKLDVKLR